MVHPTHLLGIIHRSFARQPFLWVGLLLPGWLASAADPEQKGGGPAARITLLQINDSHAYLDPHQEFFPGPDGPAYRRAGGYARIATLVQCIRKETGGKVLFGDCGDTFFGSYAAQQTRGEAMVPILNALGLDAMTPHWEFIFGPRRFVELSRRLNYPVLAINVYHKGNGQRLFPTHVIKEVAGLKVALVGIASNITDKTMPPAYSEGLRFTLGRDELPEILHQVRSHEKADLVVLVSHLGFPQDMQLLAEVPGVDVCLSGHTHNRLEQPAIAGKTIVIQAGCHGSFLGRLDLQVQDGKVVAHRYQLIEVAADVPSDPKVEALIRKAMAPYERELATVVGTTETALNRNTMLEATTDNLLLAALREATGAEIGFSNGWRWGAPVPAGPVTLNDLYNMVVMDPPLSTVQLSGEELLAMLEENLERTFARDPYDQMGGYVKRCSGLSLHVKIENPRGQRIQKLFVGREELQPQRIYKAVFITEQGVPKKYGRNRQDLPLRAVEALRRYLEKHRPVRAELVGSVVAE